MSFTFESIQNFGFEASLEQLIAYSETQARLHQSLSDREQWLFWVRSWANLQKASDAIAFPVNAQNCLEMWQEHCRGYAESDASFDFE